MVQDITYVHASQAGQVHVPRLCNYVYIWHYSNKQQRTEIMMCMKTPDAVRMAMNDSSLRRRNACQVHLQVFILIAFHAAGECRRHVIHLTHFVKNVNIVEFHGNSWNRHEKCNRVQTCLAGIGSLIREIKN